MIVRIYVYSKKSGAICYEDTGTPSDVINDIKDDMDFTLTPPPDYDRVWRWIDDKWIADNTAE